MSWSSDERIYGTPAPEFEALEERLMLTTLVGGQTAEFWAPSDTNPNGPENGHHVRIALEGDIIAEFLAVGISGGVNGTNYVTVGDLPVTITNDNNLNLPIGTEDPASIGGGIGGFDGVWPIGPTPITDNGVPIPSTLSFPWPDQALINQGEFGDINIQALASEGWVTGGRTWGFNLYLDPNLAVESYVTQLVQINNATGQAVVMADLTTVLPQHDHDLGNGNGIIQISDILSITGADFRPLDGSAEEGWLYFSAEVDDGSGSPEYELFALEVSGQTRAAIEATVPLTSVMTLTMDETQTVPSIAWEYDQSAAGTGSTLYVCRMDDTGAYIYTWGGAGGGLTGGLQLVYVGFDGELSTDIDNLSGIEFVADDRYGPEAYLYATMVDAAESQLVRIDLATGEMIGVGYTHGWNPEAPNDDRYPDGWGGAYRGDSLQGLAWNPILVNPFTGGYGVLLATDAITDELVYVRSGSDDTPADEPMLFGWTYGYAIYVSHSGPGSRISIAQVDHANPLRPMMPYSGAIPNLYVRDAQTGAMIPDLSAPGDTGNSILGALTMDYLDDVVDEGAVIVATTLGYEVGVRPANYDDWVTRSDDLAAGLVVSETLLQYYSDEALVTDRLLGNNFDDIREMAVSRSGQIVVVDYDGRDETGTSYVDDGDGIWDPNLDRIVGAQLSLVDPETGYATDGDWTDGEDPPMDIVDSATGLPILGVWGLDYGDVMMDGNEQLYAICTVGRSYAMTLGTIDLVGGQAVFTEITDLLIGGVPLSKVGAMAFSPGSGTIDGQQGLYVVDHNSNIYEVDAITGAVVSAGDLAEAALTFPDGSLTGQVETVEIMSMDFDDDGILYVQDRRSGRLVDVRIKDAFGNSLLSVGAPSGVPLPAGLRVSTTTGSVRPTVGAISYDFANDRFLAVDNVYGSAVRWDENSVHPTNPSTPRLNDSAALMVLTGTLSDSAVPQNLDKFLYGGTVTGKVTVSGSLGTFYAGWLITGQPGPTLPPANWNPDVPPPLDSLGLPLVGLTERYLADNEQYIADNFSVGGDLRNLIVKSSIGTDGIGVDSLGRDLDTPTYLTGFDLQVGGKIGQVWAMESMVGHTEVENQDDVGGYAPGTFYQEIEEFISGTVQIPISTNPSGDAFQLGRLYVAGANIFDNGSIANAQYLGGTASTLGNSDTIRVLGELGGITDNLDFYAVPMMAGQTISVQLLSAGLGLDVGVFDPDGRLVATDRNNVLDDITDEAPFRLTTERAGVYTFAVGGAPFDGTTTYSGSWPYALQVDYVTDDLHPVDLAVGGILVDQYLFHYQDLGGPTIPGMVYPNVMAPGIHVQRGDLGAIVVGTAFASESLGPDVVVEAGQMIALVAGSYGWSSNPATSLAAFEDSLDVLVYGGGVGLLRTTDDTGELFMGSIYLEGDLQTLEAAGGVLISLTATGGIGNFRAASWSSQTMAGEPSDITLNSDGIGRDGIIDLIDITGDLGSLSSGGPAISTGEGGNVRFIRVGGEVFQNTEWANTDEVQTNVEPGEPITLWDDSGTKLTIYPQADYQDAWGQTLSTNGATGEVWVPYVDVTYYGISDSGGVAIIDVISTDNLLIVADSDGNGGTAEIGRIQSNTLPTTSATGVLYDGRDVLVDPVTGAMTMEAQPAADEFNDLKVLLVSTTPIEDGGDPVDVFEIVGNHYTSIENFTGGDIVNVNALTIGRLESYGSIGLTEVYNKTELDATFELTNALPFAQQTLGVVSGHIMVVRAADAVGNLIVNGAIGSIEANYGGEVNHDDGVFAGIAAPIYATGNINTVQIGEGIASSGTGGYARAGVFSDGVIHLVENQGSGSDIRGDVIGTLGIDRIELIDGAIVDADILTSIMAGTLEYNGTPFTTASFGGDIHEILVTGDGGIIGAEIVGLNIDRIVVKDGFGLFSSFISSVSGNGRIHEVLIDGYGIQDTVFNGGAYLDSVGATGRGDIVSALNYTPTVRWSEDYQFDPLFGVRISPLTDIHAVLGTSAMYPDSVEGMWRNVDASGQLNLTEAWGYAFNGVQLTFANAIGAVRTIDEINGLRIVTGSIGQFRPGSNVYGLDMNVAGSINSINIFGDLAADSSIAAYGANGSIGSVIVRGDFDGELVADGHVGSVTIYGDLSGRFDIDDTSDAKFALKNLTLLGSLRNGALDIDGHVGAIRVAADLGATNDTLYVNGNLGVLQVGFDKTIDGSSLLLDARVMGTLGTLDVTGRVDGSVYVGGSLNKLLVRADGVTAADSELIAGEMLIRGDLNSAQISNGSVGADITVGDRIGSFVIQEGDLNAGVTLQSTYGDMGAVQIRTGDLLGAIRADRGSIQSITVGGSDLGPVSQISTNALAALIIDGDVMAGSLIDIAGELASVRIGGDVAVGGVIQAGSSKTLTVDGDLDGSVDLGFSSRQAIVTIGNDLNGDLSIDADASVTVRGDLADGATLAIGGDLNKLDVVDLLAGDVRVDGGAVNVRAGRMADAVVTTGFDLRSLTVFGDMTNSLLQVGLSAGDDGVFADGVAVAADLGEDGRMARLTSLRIDGDMNDSIIAAGGQMDKVWLRGGMTRSSVSSGLNLGSEAIAAVEADATPLADAVEQNAARSGSDRQLLRGDIRAAIVNDTGMVDSDLTAGVDAGADGDFRTAADNNVVSSLTGGASEILSINVTAADAGSAILADAGIRLRGRQTAPAAGLYDGDVSYSLNDLTAPNPADQVGTATNGSDVQYVSLGGHTVTITLTGNGQVDVYDAAGGSSDDVIDMLVITGTDARTKISVTASTAAAVSVARVVTGDDVEVGSLAIDGGLIGDTAAPVDLHLDGGVRDLTLGAMGGDESWTGRVGGDVASVDIGDQALGALRIGGSVRRIDLAEGTDNLWLIPTGDAAWAAEDVEAMTVDGAGFVWVFDGASRQLHLTSDGAGLQRVDVTDALFNTVDIDGMDYFNVGNTLYAVATIYNQTPSVQVAQAIDGPVDLVGMAVSGLGRVMAVEKGSTTDSGWDELVEIDSETGVRTTVGILRDVFSNLMVDNVMALAFSNDGTLYALLKDYDGFANGFDSNDGVTLAAIETTDVNGDGTLRVGNVVNGHQQDPGTRLGGAADTYTAMALNDAGEVYAIRRVGGQDELVQLVIDTTGPLPTVAVVSQGMVQVNTLDTNIVGIGFDSSGNLMAYNSDGASAEMVAIDMTTPGASTYITAPGILEASIDAFAVGRTDSWIGGWDDSDYPTFAYDGDSAAGTTLYTNPGVIQTLGIIDTDPASGQFTLLHALTEYAEDANGIPLADHGLNATVVDIAVDGADTSLVFMVTEDGRLLSYDRTDGRLNTDIGSLVNAYTGEIVEVTSIDFDEATGDLIGLDSRYHRLVTIDKTTGTTVPRTESGSIDGDALTGLACNAVDGGFRTFDTTTGEVMQLRRIDHGSPSGVVASSVDNLVITTEFGYHGRVTTTGNTFGKVTVAGDFLGMLSSATDIRSMIVNGDFGGAVTADGSINVMVRNGDFLVSGLVDAGETLDMRLSRGQFAGTLIAEEVKSIRSGGEEVEAGFGLSAADLAKANINVRGYAGMVSLVDAFTGTATFGSVGSLQVGSLADQGMVEVLGDAGSLTIVNGTDDTSYAVVYGSLGALNVGGVHTGVIAVAQGMGSGRLADMNEGMLLVAEDTGSVSVRNAVDSLLSFGVWIGDDFIYNTEDDVITGGSVGRVSVAQTLRDSAIVAGVLPNLNAGVGIPTDMGAYYGDADATAIEFTDSAEAGGLLVSEIGVVGVGGNVVNTSPLNGAMSVVAAADDLGRVFLKRRGSTLRTRVYADPFGAPVVTDVQTVSDSEIRIIFSEEINTGTFTLSYDMDGDDQLLHPSDIQGTIHVRDANNQFITGVTLGYTTQVTDDGDVQGVLVIHRADGFDTSAVQITLLGDLDVGIYDRSGLRSSLRDPNQDGVAETREDWAGTLLDGDANTLEGGDFWLVPSYVDAANEFSSADLFDFEQPGVGDYYRSVVILESLDTLPDDNGWNDTDVFGFGASAGEFFTYSYDGPRDNVSVALFFLDDQGTADPSDDFYEMVARHEDGVALDTDGPIDQSFELAQTGMYYLTVGYHGIDVDEYRLLMAVASSDDMLDGHINGSTGLATSETIAYVSNKVGDANNLLGANNPLQLVYVDFDGGQTTEYGQGPWGLQDVTVAPFDVAFLDTMLAGRTEQLIHGSVTAGVTGIIDNMIAIYQANPTAAINALEISTAAEWAQIQTDFANGVISSGLVFTTVDPATWGMDATEDFTTVFFDSTNVVSFGGGGLMGLASTIDMANMNKADNALVFAEGFVNAGLSSSANTLSGRLNEWSMMLSNVAAHELGHILGLNHQPTSPTLLNQVMLQADDPDNAGPLTPGDANVGIALMAYPPDFMLGFYNQYLFGTLNLEMSEFAIDYIDPVTTPIGHIDTADLIGWWLA